MTLVHKLHPTTLLLTAAMFVASAHAQTSSQTSSPTSTWKIDPAHSGIEFQIRHLGVSNVRGSFNKVIGTIQLDEQNIVQSSVAAVIDASTVNTNEPARDTHLKSPDFFDVQKNPTITFKSTSLSNANGKLQMTGDLTLAGVTKPITLNLDGPAAPQKGPRGVTVSGFSATGIIHRKDFNFGSKYSAPMLGDDVKFTIDIEMDKQ